MHNLAISTHSFGFSAMNYFGCKQLGLHGAHKTACNQPLNAHWVAGAMSNPQGCAGRQS